MWLVLGLSPVLTSESMWFHGHLQSGARSPFPSPFPNKPSQAVLWVEISRISSPKAPLPTQKHYPMHIQLP